MSNTTKLEWLQAELQAINDKINEVKVAKTNYLNSYEIVIERLEAGKEKLEELIEDQEE